MPNFNEVMERFKLQEQAGLRQREASNHVKVEVARRAQMVVDHPGWNLLVAEVETQLENAEAGKAVITRKIFGEAQTGEALVLLKQDAVRLDAITNTLKVLLERIPALIKQGEKAAEELKLL